MHSHYSRLHSIKQRVLISTVLAMLVAMVSAVNAHAKVIAVEAGIANLRAAIDSAEDGDTLVLASGIYAVTQDLLIDKALYIRGADTQNKPIFSMQDGYDLIIGNSRDCENEGEFSVTLQGVEISEAQQTTNSLVRVTVKDDSDSSTSCLDSLNILESNLIGVSLATYQFGNGNYTHASYGFFNHDARYVNTLMIVGSRVEKAGVFAQVKESIFVAYNKIIGNVQLYTHGSHEQNAYIIGNDIECNFSQTSSNYVFNSSYFSNMVYSNSANPIQTACVYTNVGNGFVIANKINHDLLDLEYNHYSILVKDGFYTVANNLIVSKLNLYNTESSGLFYSIWQDGGGNGRVFNNTIVLSDKITPTLVEEGVITVNSNNTKIYNNIIFDGRYRTISINTSDTNYRYVGNNLCYSSSEDSSCNTDYNTITEDPLLDADTYALGEDSPAIDAGVDDKYYYDLDGSIGDLGIYGGPYGFTQYQSQREDSSKPFVLPLFHNIGYVPGDTVQAKAIVIPRMK